VKRLLVQEKKCRAGLDFVLGELIGWLWFAIGRSHVSDRLPRPHTNKHIIREEMSLQEGGEVFSIKYYKGHEFKKKINQ